MNQKSKKIRIAVQKKGRLQTDSLKYLNRLGLKVKPYGRNLIENCLNADVEILYVRNSDIPQFVKYGIADYGILGENILAEKKYRLKILKKLGFGNCKLIIAAPKNFRIKNIADLREERIATSYRNSLKDFLKEKGISASIIEINGSVEICPQLKLSDAICDITQTGATLKANNLKIIDTILESQAVLVCSPNSNKEISEDFENLITKKI